MAYNNYGNNNNGYNGYNNNNGGYKKNNYGKSNYGNGNGGYNNGNNGGTTQRSNSRLVKVGAIWKKMKNGKEVLSMQIDGKNYLIYPNTFKQTPIQPDFNVCIMSDANNAGNGGYVAQNKGYNKGNNGNYNSNNAGTNNTGANNTGYNGYNSNGAGYNGNNGGYVENGNGNGNGYGSNNYQKAEAPQPINEYNKNATPEDMEQAADNEYPDLSL